MFGWLKIKTQNGNNNGLYEILHFVYRNIVFQNISKCQKESLCVLFEFCPLFSVSNDEL
jgi:hypothetical protein